MQAANAGGHDAFVTAIGGLDKDYWNGRTEIVLGIVLLVLVAIWILDLDVPSPAMGVAIVGVAVVVVPVATYFTTAYYSLSLKDTADAMARIGGSAGPGIGLLLAAGGGILAAIGGGVGVLQE